MRRSSFLVAVLAAALCAALAASPADATPAADATQGAGASPVADGVAPNAAPPVPSPLPTLALSDKPGPGCCCIRTGPGKAPACSDGCRRGRASPRRVRSPAGAPPGPRASASSRDAHGATDLRRRTMRDA